MPGCWPQPMARLQQKKQAAVTTGSAEHRHSPRDGFHSYNVLSPVYGCLATVVQEVIIPLDLTPASRRQDHTASCPPIAVRPRASTLRQQAAIAFPPHVS